MKGTNEITKPFHSRDTLLVHSLFPTIQGEGPDAGRVSVFVRLARCNLACSWCDTEFDTGELSEHKTVIKRVLDIAAVCRAKLVVITGGEPLLQNIIPLVRGCNDTGMAVAVETAGTVYTPLLNSCFSGGNKRWMGNIVVCSPKTPGLAGELIPLIGAYKYVIRAGEVAEEDGLPIYSTQIPGKLQKLFRPPSGSCVYVQPCTEDDPIKNKANIDAAVLSCMRFGYRFSARIHLIANMP